jgi:hypothetical protein
MPETTTIPPETPSTEVVLKNKLQQIGLARSEAVINLNNLEKQVEGAKTLCQELAGAVKVLQQLLQETSG